MSRDLSRRALLTLPLLGVLAGCQIAENRLIVEVAQGAEVVFFETVRAFAVEHKFSYNAQDFEGPGSRFDIELDGWRTRVLIYGTVHVGFYVSFRNKDDLWLLLVPDVDLSAFANEFRSAFAGVDGIEVRDDV